MINLWLNTQPMMYTPGQVAPPDFRERQHKLFAELFDDVPDDTPAKIVGDYFVQKYRSRAANFGVQPVARQLRKQGVAVEIAVLMLAVRP